MKIDSSVGFSDILSLKVISILEFKSTLVESDLGETEITSGGAVSTGPPGGIPSLAQCKETKIKKIEVNPIDFFDFMTLHGVRTFVLTPESSSSDQAVVGMRSYAFDSSLGRNKHEFGVLRSGKRPTLLTENLLINRIQRASMDKSNRILVEVHV